MILENFEFIYLWKNINAINLLGTMWKWKNGKYISKCAKTYIKK